MTKSFSKSLVADQQPQDLEDNCLIRSFIAGDQAAFDKIVEKYADTITNLSNRLLGWPGDVDDITQEVFLAAFLGLKKFSFKANLKTWLFTITINKTKSVKAKRFLQKKQMLNLEVVTDHNYHSTTAETNLAEKERSQQIRSAIAILSDKYRQPIVLRYLYEFEISEISKMLGISVNAVNTRLSRARELLKEPLSKMLEQEI